VTRDLARLAAGCALVLAPGGLLVFATNSTKVSSAEVDRALAEGGAAAGADLRIVERVGLPPDFPVAPGFPEGNYLKVAIAAKA
jgi:23S rRNA (cytosine1962-C5)-methyltransferase